MCVKGWSWLKPGPSHPQLLQGWLSVGRSRTTCAHDSGKHWADRAVHRVGPKNQASTNLVAAQRVWKKLYQDPGFLWGSSCSCFLHAKKLFCALWLLSHQTANRKSIAQCPNNSSSLPKRRPGSPECTCFPHLLQATEPGPQMYFGAASECHWTWQTAAGGNLCRASWKAVSSHLHWNPAFFRSNCLARREGYVSEGQVWEQHRCRPRGKHSRQRLSHFVCIRAN